MNDFVTVYELLGLIKDGKAPKKIEYQGNVLEFDGEDYKYYKDADVLSEDSLVKYIAVGNLNDKVEILEEDKPIIEKIDTTTENTLFTMECYTGIPEKAQDWNFNILKDKLNELIDYINKKEKGND